jgi:hypothetical protein
MRMVIKSPGFAAIAIGSLALGIGANTAIFILAKQVLLDRLRVPHPQQLQFFRWRAPEQNIVHHLWVIPIRRPEASARVPRFLIRYISSPATTIDRMTTSLRSRMSVA